MNYTTKITTTTNDKTGYIKQCYNPAEAFPDGVIPDDAITVSSEVATAMINSMRTDKHLTVEQAEAAVNG